MVITVILSAGSSSGLLGASPSAEYELTGTGSTGQQSTVMNDNDSLQRPIQQEFKHEYKQEYMVSGYSSPDTRVTPMNTDDIPTADAPTTVSRPAGQDLSCSPFTPASATATSPSLGCPGTIFPNGGHPGAPPTGGLHHAAGVPAGVIPSANHPAAAASYPGYLSGGYYTSGPGQGYVSSSVSILYPHLYQQQGQFLLDSRQEHQYPRQDCRDLVSSVPMLDEQSLQGRYLSSRTGGPSPNDPSVWRPY